MEELSMKKFLKHAVFISIMFMLCLFTGCSNASSSSNTSTNNPEAPGEQNTPKLLYWDNQSQTFKGTASWTAQNTYQQVLLGYEGLSDYVEKVEWKITPLNPSFPEYFGWTETGTYSINSDFTELTAYLNTTQGNAFAYADLPNTTITVTIYFTTGESVVIGNQTGYSGYEGPYPEDIDSYLYSYASMSQDAEYYLKASVSDKRIKIKSATAYLPGGSTRTASIDWTSSNFDSYTSFEPIIRRQYASDFILRLVMTTLQGTTIDIDRSLRGKKYRGSITLNSQTYYIKLDFLETNQVKCYEYTNANFSNVKNEYEESCWMGNDNVNIYLFNADIHLYYTRDNWETINVYASLQNGGEEKLGTLHIVN